MALNIKFEKAANPVTFKNVSGVTQVFYMPSRGADFDADVKLKPGATFVAEYQVDIDLLRGKLAEE